MVSLTRAVLVGLGAALAAAAASAAVTDPNDLKKSADIDVPPALEHCDEAVAGRDFDEIFECGDEIFGTRFNEADGVGANIGDGGRFTKVPRSDLKGARQWFNHKPPRAVGPEASSCQECHLQPAGDGAAPVSLNSIRDPLRTGNVAQFIQRNPPHLFAPGAIQLLAEEITRNLADDVREAVDEACNSNPRKTVDDPLTGKGINYGRVTVTPGARTGNCNPRVQVNAQGIDRDLVVKPFGWKGNVPNLRPFNRFATGMEIGMQAVEEVGNTDGDFDGVINEITVADMSALTVYLANQPRPTTRVELSALRDMFVAAGRSDEADALGLPMVTAAERSSINRGSQIFQQIGCASCHRPQLILNDPVFREPSRNAPFRDATFPSGQNPVQAGVDPARPLRSNLLVDPPDNRFQFGNRTVSIGVLTPDGNGGAIVNLFSDLKRHDLGAGIAESVDEAGTGRSVFLTETLWGVGSTDQYMHDGRATTLTSAILEHGGEAAQSRTNFRMLSAQDQRDLLAALKNLVLFFAS